MVNGSPKMLPDNMSINIQRSLREDSPLLFSNSMHVSKVNNPDQKNMKSSVESTLWFNK